MFSRLFRKKNKIEPSKNEFCNNLYLKDSLSNKEKFDNIISFAKEIIDSCEGNTYKEHPILDFIRIVGRRIQTDYMGYLLYSGKKESNYSNLEAREAMFNIHGAIKDKNGKSVRISKIIEEKQFTKKVSLSKDLILPWPWRRDRIQNCIINIGEDRKWGKWEQDYNNHYVDVWLPMGIIWVWGGNHSITIGIVQGGEIEADKYSDISKVYDYIRCDGEEFIEITTGKVIEKVKSPEFAAIFEIGRMMSEKGISYIN